MYTYPILTKLGLTTSFLAAIAYLYQWQSPRVNIDLRPKSEQSWHEMIHTNLNCKQTNVTSMGNEFDVFYIENIQPNDPYAFAPYFPAIEITTKNNHNVWLQVIRTDTEHHSLKVFIDSYSEDYPFYSRGKNFYDLPSWNYTFFTKPLTTWLAHAYSIELDEEDKTIKCVGGISWGFKFNQLGFQPTMILPTSLTQQDWQSDWKVFQEALSDYQDLTNLKD